MSTWPHLQIPKLNKYELAANIFQGRDMQPADENGLADPYAIWPQVA